ncbi:MAG: hypothetical protein AAFR96_04545 [Planctomycetota bacterium]
MIESVSQGVGFRMGVWVALALPLVGAGCGPSSGNLTANDFAGGDGSGVRTPPRVFSIASAPAASTQIMLGASDTVGVVGSPVAAPAMPASEADRESGATGSLGANDEGANDGDESGEAIVLDAKVADVNGRPIIASVFLEDLMPRLRAATQTAPSVAAWRAEALQIIQQKLFLTVRDEVLYREAQASLPPEVRAIGLRNFLGQYRERIRLLNSGSVTQAERRLQEQYGQSLDEFLESQQRQQLIAQRLNDLSDSYAPVTWADVQNEYARRIDEFQPRPVVFGRMILPPGEAEAGSVLARLKAGEPFAAIAEDRELNRYRPGSGGLIDDDGTEVEGERSEMRLVGFESLNASLVGLEPGAWAGPIEYMGDREGFVMLDRLEQPPGRTLEDGRLQLELEAEIDWRRRQAARDRLVAELLNDAGFGLARQREIAVELREIAQARLAATQLASGSSGGS